MSNILPTRSLPTTAEELQTLQKHWRWFLALGIGMAALGTFAIGWACIVTLTVTATWLFGFLMLAGGIAEIASSFSRCRHPLGISIPTREWLVCRHSSP